MGALQAYNSDFRFPIKPMLMGLIEYSASFLLVMIHMRYGYNCNEHLVHYVTRVTAIFVQISRPPDYRSWLQTMHCDF